MDAIENWKDIHNYEGYYQASDLGRIRRVSNVSKESINKPYLNKYGYLILKLSKNGKAKTFTVHRLVALAFLENPNLLPIINHKDCDKTNNKITNLEWCTSDFNTRHAVENGRLIGFTHSNRKLNLIKAREIRFQYSNGSSLKFLGRCYGVHSNTVRAIVRNITWKT